MNNNFSPEDLPTPEPNVNFKHHPRYSGKIIKIKEKHLNKNHRDASRRGEGWKAWNLILSKQGSISYEEYRKLGGRNDHLDWDLGVHPDRYNKPAYIELVDNIESSNLNMLAGVPSKEKPPLNQILCGPPGTGKTYATKELAVNIISDKDFVGNRAALNIEYKRLCKDKRIEFVTFHQSYGYEEFVEGIRPNLSDDDSGSIEYEIKAGIFKQICERANKQFNKNIGDNNSEEQQAINIDKFKNSKVWWIVLKYEHDEWIENCLNNNHVLLTVEKNNQGIGNMDDPSEFNKVPPKIDGEVNRMWDFYKGMQEDDIFVISTQKKDRNICAVGILGKYKYKENNGRFKHTREVTKWLLSSDDNPIDISDITSGIHLTQGIILDEIGIPSNKLLNKLSRQENNAKDKEDIHSSSNDYVLIIDEINRGNISKILGELITLLEEDKRKDAKEELEVTLPYSGEIFSVPKNLHIIGTMNTADRSIAFLDTALRRRFEFEEMMPKYELVNYDIAGVQINKVLETINNGIKRELDRDHQIGHSYFMGGKANTIEGLANVFKNNICPLLEEYFYDRRDEIPKILNNCDLVDGDGKNWSWNYDVFDKPYSYQKIYES